MTIRCKHVHRLKLHNLKKNCAAHLPVKRGIGEVPTLPIFPEDFRFLVCRLDKLLSWFSTQTSVVNSRYYLLCLCNVRRQYLLPGILGIYCFLTGVPSLPAIALPKGRICSLVNQVYTSLR